MLNKMTELQKRTLKTLTCQLQQHLIHVHQYYILEIDKTKLSNEITYSAGIQTAPYGGIYYGGDIIRPQLITSTTVEYDEETNTERTITNKCYTIITQMFNFLSEITLVEINSLTINRKPGRIIFKCSQLGEVTFSIMDRYVYAETPAMAIDLSDEDLIANARYWDLIKDITDREFTFVEAPSGTVHSIFYTFLGNRERDIRILETYYRHKTTPPTNKIVEVVAEEGQPSYGVIIFK